MTVCHFSWPNSRSVQIDSLSELTRPLVADSHGRPAWGGSLVHTEKEKAAMYRIFKKKHDLAARDTVGRARRPRRQRLGLEALEGRQLMSVGLNDFLVNVNTSGAQFFSDNASSANGMHVAVWGTNGFGDSD